MKTLLVNGCSWTYGGGLDHPDNKEVITNLHDNIVWPAHVKKLMNFDTCVNLAEGCGSNQRICRTTFDWVSQQDEETLKNTTVIIQWSCEDRYEYYVPTEEESADFQKRYQVSSMTSDEINKLNEYDYSVIKNLDRWAKVNPHGVISFVEDHHNAEVKKQALSRYRTYTDQEAMYTWLFHMGFLYDFLTSKGITCYYWYFNQYVVAMPQEIQDYIYNHFPMLEDDEDQTRCHRWEYERIGNGDSHPSETGHAQLGQHIVDAIAKKKTILRTP
jgi:hypothetical protein